MTKFLLKYFLYFKIFFLVFIQSTVSNPDWCDVQKKYCDEGKKHIGCEDTMEKGNCTNISVIPMSDEMKGYILNNHNILRNEIAGGLMPPFLSASHMKELIWNDDLASLAEIHVKHCKWAHDQCRATPEHPYAGQNIGEIKNKKKSVDFEERITRMTKAWLKEKEFCNKQDIANYTGTNPKEIRHFTTMVQDLANEIGCAYIIFEEITQLKHWHVHMMTCNYAYTTIKYKAVYKNGIPCSDCGEFNATCSKTYPNLCTSGSSSKASLRKVDDLIKQSNSPHSSKTDTTRLSNKIITSTVSSNDMELTTENLKQSTLQSTISTLELTTKSKNSTSESPKKFDKLLSDKSEGNIKRTNFKYFYILIFLNLIKLI